MYQTQLNQYSCCILQRGCSVLCWMCRIHCGWIYYIHTTSASCSGQWQHGHVCTLVMQQPIAACTRAQSLTRPCPCATYIRLLHSAPTSAQDGFDPLQLALVVVFILPSIIWRKDLTCTCSGHHVQLAMLVFYSHHADMDIKAYVGAYVLLSLIYSHSTWWCNGKISLPLLSPPLCKPMWSHIEDITGSANSFLPTKRISWLHPGVTLI